jgi:hypothetical protein
MQKPDVRPSWDWVQSYHEEESMLSKADLSLFRGYTSEIPVDASNRTACRELAAEGLFVVGHDLTRAGKRSTP